MKLRDMVMCLKLDELMRFWNLNYVFVMNIILLVRLTIAISG